MTLSRKNSEKWVVAIAMIGLGRVLGKKKPRQLDRVEDCFSEGLAILHHLKMKPDYSLGRLFLGEFYLDTGHKEKAMERMRKLGYM